MGSDERWAFPANVQNLPTDTAKRELHHRSNDRIHHEELRKVSTPLMNCGLAAPLLFASGAAALVYQVLWIKQLSLIVGVDVYAVSTGISAFFLGLALGG